MRITDFLNKDSILEELTSETKEGVLRELVSLLAKNGKIKDEKKSLRGPL